MIRHKHTSLFQEFCHHFPFAACAVLREACMSAALSAARVQVNQYQWANTNTQANTSHVCSWSSVCMPTLDRPDSISIYTTYRAPYGLQSQVLCGDTCDSAWFRGCPLGCAVLHTVPTACLPSETKHLWVSILQGPYTAEDVPLGNTLRLFWFFFFTARHWLWPLCFISRIFLTTLMSSQQGSLWRRHFDRCKLLFLMQGDSIFSSKLSQHYKQRGVECGTEKKEREIGPEWGRACRDVRVWVHTRPKERKKTKHNSVRGSNKRWSY